MAHVNKFVMDKKDTEKASGGALPGAVSIAVVERETGLSKDTLRMWERRYGFPRPQRDERGERAYSADQLERLRLIRRCLDLGLRPGRIVAAPLGELSAHLRGPDACAAADGGGALEPLPEPLQHLKAGRIAEMREWFMQSLLRLGLQRFLLEVVEPVNAAVGRAWVRGEIAIHEEHLYSEQIGHLLRQAIGTSAHPAATPRVLLTTLPGEEHQLGLLMAQGWLAVEGANCISLGLQTPASDIVSAARAYGADIVGLSFSAALQPRAAATGAADLRQRLDPGIELWAGGAVWSRVRQPPAGLRVLTALTDIGPALAAWRAGRSGRAA